MKVPYFKKTKMYKMVSELLSGMEISKLLDSTYKFYRGSEWLHLVASEIGDDSVIFVSFYHFGYFLSMDLEYRDAEDTDKLRKIIRYTYRLQPDSSLKLKYFFEHDDFI